MEKRAKSGSKAVPRREKLAAALKRNMARRKAGAVRTAGNAADTAAAMSGKTAQATASGAGNDAS